MKRFTLTFVLVGIFIYGNFAGATMTSTNYEIKWDSLNAGGSDTSSSASYGLRDSISQLTSGGGTSTTYQESVGYRAGIFDQVISFSYFLQNTSARSVTALTNTVISTTDTAGISVGDYVMLVQDVSTSYISAVGKVASVSAGVSVTVDSLTNGGSAPTIDGTNDSLYLMNSSSLTFNTLTTTTTQNIVLGFEVTADIDNGYVVQIMDNGEMQSVIGEKLNDVTDGTVTAGKSEFGARSSDTTLAETTFDTEDTAITTSFQDVATESTAKYEDRKFVILKAATDSGVGGTFTNSITIVASGNF